MPTFGQRSLENLSEAHPDLQRAMHEAIKEYDFTVICGHRGKADQEKAYKEGNSNAKWLQSPHNYKPALAVDIAPYPIDWKNIKRFDELGNIVMACAERLGVKLRWGKHFKSKRTGKSLADYPHFELDDWQSYK